jgi:hypothetical protein
MLGLKLGWITGYPGFFTVFPQSLQANVGTVPRLGHNHLFPNPFQYIIHQPPYHSRLYIPDIDSIIKYATGNKQF